MPTPAVTVQTVMNLMERIAPKHLAEDWDNPGLLVGSPVQPVTGIITCLDVSDIVIEQALAHDANLIISHHPLIFKPQKHLRTDQPLGALLQKLLQHNLNVFAAHTNLDIAEGGVNDVLAAKIGLGKLSTLLITSQDQDGTPHSLGRIGYLPQPMTLQAFAAQVKASLPCTYLRYVDAGMRPVRKVALCSGSGADLIDRAALLGADCYVTGDIRYHDAQHAQALGLHLIDAGHYATEFPIAAAMATRLRDALSHVPIYADQQSKDFFAVM